MVIYDGADVVARVHHMDDGYMFKVDDTYRFTGKDLRDLARAINNHMNRIVIIVNEVEQKTND
jgi:hypothetical protein